MPLLGMHSEQDDGPRRRPAGRGPARPRHGRRHDRRPRLGTRRPPGPGRAHPPPIPGLADGPYWTNREAIEAKELPESLLVLGGGAIGMELAQVFARFGVQITVVEAADRLVPGEEPEASALLARVLGAEGIEILTGARAAHVRHDGSRFTVALEGGREVGAERLLVATGRRADPAALGVETIGLDPRARWVDTDEHLRAAPGVWAVGDLTGRGAFTHVAMYQAAIAIRSILREARAGAG